MKISTCIASASALCLLGGCSSVVDHPESVAPPTTEVGGDEAGARNSVPHDGTVDAQAPEAPLVRGYVAGTFPGPLTDTNQCQPLGYPMTAFLNDVFGPEALVQDVGKWISATECRQEQVLDAPADAWATYVYQTICRGRGDASLCGAQATRRCSVDTMLNWAEERTGVFEAMDEVFHFTYVVVPRNDASRKALYHRALDEAWTLLTESESVLREEAMGERHCPGEDYASIASAYADGLGLFGRISGQVSGEAKD